MKTKIACCLLFITTSISAFYNENALRADPDQIHSSFKWTSQSLPMLCVGEYIQWKRVSIGGMIEVRNEKRFNQEIFPNHNWRGIGRLEVRLTEYNYNNLSISLLTDIRHESAHPTMGIVEQTDKAYELIYDNVYRRMILNAVSASTIFTGIYGQNTFSFRSYYHFFFMSKNTPELTGSKLTESHGLSTGIQWHYNFNGTDGAYISLFDRYIFNSSKKASGKLHTGNGKSLSESEITYPVIHHVNTIAVKTGYTREIGKNGRKAGIFLEYLYGNPFGFIDSRDKRSVKAVGFEFYH